MTHLAALCRLLPERDPHPQIHAALTRMLDDLLDAHRAAPSMVHFEMQLLAELGFGLDLSSCAASGAETDLIYVSPKSGRAVSRQAGEPWKDKLLVLPEFLREGSGREPSPQDIAAGFELTGFFLARHVLEPRGLNLADARASFIAALGREARPAMAIGGGERAGFCPARLPQSVPPTMMPMVPPPPVPVAIGAPVSLIDRVPQMGGGCDRGAPCRGGQAR